MKIPAIKGIIDRRILINFAVEPDIAKNIVPVPFTPKLINGKAIAGICLIRLKHVRPKGLPAFIGFGSENGAHRIAVEWTENGKKREGVYIPRRDTTSGFNVLAGGRLFPGRHYRAEFNVVEKDARYHVAFKSSDGAVVSVDAHIENEFPINSIFKDIQAASAFFKTGSTGYSPNKNRYDGLFLNAYTWDIKPMEVSRLQSSYFEDKRIFPEGTVKFDNALLMTNIEHEWHSVPDTFCR
jgi:hypothetical protein